MRFARALFPAFVLFLASGSSAYAMKWPGQDHLSTQYPGAPQSVPDRPQSPYAMTYMDEVAQSLGIKNRHMDVFSTGESSGYMPSFSAGVGSDGAMFRLKWHPGE